MWNVVNVHLCSDKWGGCPEPRGSSGHPDKRGQHQHLSPTGTTRYWGETPWIYICCQIWSLDSIKLIVFLQNFFLQQEKFKWKTCCLFIVFWIFTAPSFYLATFTFRAHTHNSSKYNFFCCEAVDLVAAQGECLVNVEV